MKVSAEVEDVWLEHPSHQFYRAGMQGTKDQEKLNENAVGSRLAERPVPGFA